MKKEILLWMLLSGQSTTTFANWYDNSKNQEIFDNFSVNNEKKSYKISSNEIHEILQDDIKQKIIKWTLIYFEKDVTFSLTPAEKSQLEWELNDYLKKYPNIVYSNWNNVLLNLNDTNFRELFKILLPYLWKWKELNKYPPIIRNNSNLIINHIIKAKWNDAEKYFFRQFWNLIRRIVEQQGWFMTIWYYRQEMLKIIPNQYIKNTDYPPEILNNDIRLLQKYFQP